jgi:hypothetical protein
MKILGTGETNHGRNPMLNPEDVSPDDLADSIGQILKNLKVGNTWTKDRLALKAELLSALEMANYLPLSGRRAEFSLDKVGDSVIYRVPENKTGYLKPFRGKVVRIVCTGYIYRSQYAFMAGPI